MILEKLIHYLCLHIENQIKAGADVVQIFDSWAGLIPPDDLNSLCYEPNFKIVEFCFMPQNEKWFIKFICLCLCCHSIYSYHHFNYLMIILTSIVTAQLNLNLTQLELD